MSLILCPECKHEISDKAPYCIHCGFPLNTSYQSGQIREDSMPIAAAAYICDTSDGYSDFRNNDSIVSSCGVELLNIGKKKILAIKITRELFHLGLVEAKSMIEQPRIIVANNLSADEANKIVEEYKINGIQATVISL